MSLLFKGKVETQKDAQQQVCVASCVSTLVWGALGAAKTTMAASSYPRTAIIGQTEKKITSPA
ncbi:hypothetical protein [Pandoraea sp.]|uniref:hypothetical protein n=1 Tax=Pandoraea sp. TaxID=1883445 RepID=UPI00120BD84D|nr:hypothetical protein [Pandoraea sp.]TAL56979.1 MAG: hypothetical protein EPN80_00905 [Pandoraea sp.]TAM18021.1 MAG: hypothetical protein EPN65_08000 [Pandoraea sp.]